MTNQKEQGSRRDWEAKIIAHAWKDQNFKRELLSNPEKALKEYNGPQKIDSCLSYILC